MLTINSNGEKRMLRRKTWVGAVAGCLALSAVLGASGWAATSGSHYNYGVEGVQGATVGPPGWHYRMYNFWYSPDELKDNSGNTVPVDFDLEVFASVQRLIHVTGIKILGADYLYDILIPLVDQKFSFGGFSDSHSFSVGDITIEPFALAWHQPRWDALSAWAWSCPPAILRVMKRPRPGLATGRD
jgi:hypothetical protein